MSEQPFGFTVARAEVREFRAGKSVVLGPGWRVYLPHQCDEWDIPDRFSVPHGEAVARLEAFIAEAAEALEALRRGEEFGRG